MSPSTTLYAVNFAVAGSREGFGPFLGVYLQNRGFDPAATGFAMSLAGIAGLLATVPLGALIDRIESKRVALIAAVVAIAIGAVIIVASGSLWIIAAAQILIGVADTSIAPLLAALTLGLVGQRLYGAQVSKNEAFNHAGNAANAALAGLLGYEMGLGTVAAAIVVTAIVSSVVTGLIDPQAIDHAAARSGEKDERSTLKALVQTRGLILLALTILLFEAANGAVLPFLAQARTAAGSDPSVTTGVMTVIAQATMVGAALLAAPFARWRGHASALTLALGIVVLRCLVAYFTTSWFTVVPVQVLDGLSMGLAGVAMPALTADVMTGSGRASAGLGAVMTAFGAGAAISPLLAGIVAQRSSFQMSFLALGGVAVLSLLVWTLGRRWSAVHVADDRGKPNPLRPDIRPRASMNGGRDCTAVTRGLRLFARERCLAVRSFPPFETIHGSFTAFT